MMCGSRGGKFHSNDRATGGFADQSERRRCGTLPGFHGKLVTKLLRAHGECLGVRRRRRTWLAAKSSGESQAGVDPEISEWGNPAGVISRHPLAEYIGRGTRTGGIE